jgi:hypothetical protein
MPKTPIFGRYAEIPYDQKTPEPAGGMPLNYGRGDEARRGLRQARRGDFS